MSSEQAPILDTGWQGQPLTEALSHGSVGARITLFDTALAAAVLSASLLPAGVVSTFLLAGCRDTR
jgi:hypothetical protein